MPLTWCVTAGESSPGDDCPVIDQGDAPGRRRPLGARDGRRSLLFS